jgi:hypothetical protein
MRTYLVATVALAFLLATAQAFAATGSSQATSTTTTTTTTQTTATGPEHGIEGCVVKEGSDFFLIPERGVPFKLQSSQDLSIDDGHRVMVKGKEISMPAANAPSNMGAAANTQAAAGTGNDLHNLSNRELIVDSVKSMADTCPVNWNPISGRRAR